jgi:peroxiredoxin Q/BCP
MLLEGTKAPAFSLKDDEGKDVTLSQFGEKTMFGKKMTGIVRSTFIIDGSGTIAKVFLKVNPENHAAEILAVLG